MGYFTAFRMTEKMHWTVILSNAKNLPVCINYCLRTNLVGTGVPCVPTALSALLFSTNPTQKQQR